MYQCHRKICITVTAFVSKKEANRLVKLARVELVFEMNYSAVRNEMFASVSHTSSVADDPVQAFNSKRNY